MNLSWTHTHLIFNHFPIIGTIFGLLLLIYALIKDSDDLKEASYWTFLIVALITVLVFYSGTQAATAVTDIPNVSHRFIHAHRQVAENALVALEVIGVMSFVGLVHSLKGKRTPNWFAITLLIFTVIATAFVTWTGFQGGIIRHTEVRQEFPFLIPEEERNGHTHGEEGAHRESEGTTQESQEQEQSSPPQSETHPDHEHTHN